MTVSQSLPNQAPMLPDSAELQGNAFRNAVAAVIVGASALTLAGCESSSSDRLASASKAGQYISFDDGKYIGATNTDPRSRATSIEILDAGILTGSGSLVKVGDKYEIMTVEHVARAIKGLPSNTPHTSTGVTAEGKPQKSTEPGFSIPGVGVFKLKGKLSYEGATKPNDENVVDRLATFELTGQEQSAVKQAEKSGTISVPEKTEFKASFGEKFYMPLANTGKKMPFVYLYSEPNGQPYLAPLFLLNQDFDYTAGMKLLATMTAANKAQFDAENSQYDPTTPMAVALTQLQQKLFTKYANNPKSAAVWLPCDGDSGSPFLDAKGNVVGVLSLGEQFSDPTGKDSFAGSRIARADPDGTINANFACLGSAVLATG